MGIPILIRKLWERRIFQTIRKELFKGGISHDMTKMIIIVSDMGRHEWKAAWFLGRLSLPLLYWDVVVKLRESLCYSWETRDVIVTYRSCVSLRCASVDLMHVDVSKWLPLERQLTYPSRHVITISWAFW